MVGATHEPRDGGGEVVGGVGILSWHLPSHTGPSPTSDGELSLPCRLYLSLPHLSPWFLYQWLAPVVLGRTRLDIYILSRWDQLQHLLQSASLFRWFWLSHPVD